MADGMRIERRYVDTGQGQMHLSESGNGPTIVLLHWVPLSGRLYDDELPALAEAGFHAVAVDLMGFGRSDGYDGVWTFEQHTDALAAALEAAGVSTFALVGGHFSAPMTLELAMRSEFDVTALVLDGSAHLMPESALADIAKRSHRLAGPGLHADGSHRQFLWDNAINALTVFDPDFEPDETNVHLVYRFILDYLSTDPPRDYGAFAAYPAAERLAALRCPVMIVSAETDVLRAAYEPALSAAGDGATGHMFAGSHPLVVPSRRGEYAGEIVRFLKDVER